MPRVPAKACEGISDLLATHSAWYTTRADATCMSVPTLPLALNVVDGVLNELFKTANPIPKP